MPQKTIADTCRTEVGAVRAAVTAFENAVEHYLTQIPDEDYHAWQGVISATGPLTEASEALYDRACGESRKLEDLDLP